LADKQNNAKATFMSNGSIELNVLHEENNKEVHVLKGSFDAVEKKWLLGWNKKQFKGIKNPDLWKRFLKIYNPKTTVFNWIKGHNNHPQNERCDFLAVQASKKESLQEDTGYTKTENLLF